MIAWGFMTLNYMSPILVQPICYLLFGLMGFMYPVDKMYLLEFNASSIH